MPNAQHRADQAAMIARRYPRRATLRGGRSVDVRLMDEADRDRFLAFTQSLQPDDLLYLPWDITDPAVVDAWLANIRGHRTITVLAVEADKIVGEASLIQSGATWTRHIGEIRVSVAPSRRGLGLGRFLAEEIYAIADTLGLDKLSARMTHDQKSAQAVFRGLGFDQVAVLPGWVKDRNDRERDLVVMAYDIRSRRAPRSAQEQG